MAQQFVSYEEFQQFKADFNEKYEQTRKLVTLQTITIDKKIRELSSAVQTFVSRKPDPGLARDFWIRQVPKIREELQAIKLQLAKMAARANPEGRKEE